MLAFHIQTDDFDPDDFMQATLREVVEECVREALQGVLTDEEEARVTCTITGKSLESYDVAFEGPEDLVDKAIAAVEAAQ